MSIGDGEEQRHLLHREDVLPWIEAAQAARLNADVLDRLMPPSEGSFLRPTLDDPLKNMTWWCHGYLQAAVDHLLLWADYAAPLKFHPGAETVHTLRPVFTLARAAMESAAQAIWILSPEEHVDCLRRYVQLAISDLDEQTKAAETAEARAELQSRRDELFTAIGQSRRKWAPPKYIDMIRAAAELLIEGDSTSPMNPDRVERLWRSAAGAAHGKQWTEFELHDHVDARDGLYYSTPKVEAISDVLEVASKFLSAGVILFAMRAGRMTDFDDLWQEATVRLAGRITTVSGEPIRPEDVPDFPVKAP